MSTLELPREVERRFLIEPQSIPFNIDDLDSHRIVQSYLPLPDENVSYRLFAQDDGFALVAARTDMAVHTLYFNQQAAGTLPRLIGTVYHDAQTGALNLPEGSVLRVRTKLDQNQQMTGEITIKIYDGGTIECEGYMDAGIAAQMAEALGYKNLIKRRHDFPVDPYHVELDVFEGALGGLIIAEIEEEPGGPDVSGFMPPGWFGPEITGMLEFSNAALAEAGIPQEKMRGLGRPSLPGP